MTVFCFSPRDIMSIYKEPPPGMFVVPDPHDMTKVGGDQNAAFCSVLCRVLPMGVSFWVWTEADVLQLTLSGLKIPLSQQPVKKSS